MTGHTSFEELLAKPYRRWFQFGWRSPQILYKRLRNKYRPIFGLRMRWQRSKRGWSVQDSWGLHWYLEDVIIGVVTHWLEMPPHGHPSTGHYNVETGKYDEGDLTYEDWIQILNEIVIGMKAAKIYSNEYEWEEGGEEAFNLAMDHLKTWWCDLWD